MDLEDFERHECTVNSNELAVHARALQRSKRQLPFPYRKNPLSVPTLFGEELTQLHVQLLTPAGLFLMFLFLRF